MAGNGHDHGNTPAAWTGVIIALIGFTAGGVFMIMAEPLLVIASMVIVLLGGVATLVMRSMGLGKPAAAVPAQRTAPSVATGSQEAASEKAAV